MAPSSKRPCPSCGKVLGQRHRLRHIISHAAAAQVTATLQSRADDELSNPPSSGKYVLPTSFGHLSDGGNFSDYGFDNDEPWDRPLDAPSPEIDKMDVDLNADELDPILNPLVSLGPSVEDPHQDPGLIELQEMMVRIIQGEDEYSFMQGELFSPFGPPKC